MADKSVTQLGLAALLVVALAACGQKGKLYLPEPASQVVTRPAATPDSQPAPAPEVTAPEGSSPEEKDEAADPKKDKGAAPPPPK